MGGEKSTFTPTEPLKQEKELEMGSVDFSMSPDYHANTTTWTWEVAVWAPPEGLEGLAYSAMTLPSPLE